MEDYRKTLNLLTTTFPMKADLPRREPEVLSFWERIGLYQKYLNKNRDKPKFILHDGPPYSNGHVHLGTALNKILKDIVVKFKGMSGYLTPFVPGWDNHGMPIENEIIREFREGQRDLDRFAVRKRCREFAQEWIDIQRREFQRLGVMGDWANPYLTMSREYESKILETFADLVEKGYIYRSPRPVHWCIVCKTSLANIEIEYRTKTSYSLWIRFPLVRDPNGIFWGLPRERSYAMVWTTTPWTIPANLAITAHPDFIYTIIKEGEDYYLLARDLVGAARVALGLTEVKILKEVLGRDLDGLVFRHPIFDRESKIILGTFVTSDTGTGLVHTAPGHGYEDFEIGRSYNLPILCPVDESGRFTDEALEFAGLDLKSGDLAVMDTLRREKNLLKQDTIEHSYPFCWRCRNPLIFRTTLQWYMKIDHNDDRQRKLTALEKVRWFPERSLDRMRAFVTAQPDWCLSRQRFWGVGIPVFYCKKCGEAILSAPVIRKVAQLVNESSAEVWYDDEKMGMVFKNLTCPECGASDLIREKDILDVWFDSSCSNLVVLESRADHNWPADLYLEGSDQHRGWFSLSLTVAMARRGEPPFKAVITHGFVLDKDGMAMHKSLGNAISPQDIVDRYGADVLRLWVASSEYFDDVRCGDEILERVVEAYRKIRNTIRFLLINTADFNYQSDRVGDQEIKFIDRYIRSRLQKVIEEALKGYNDYEFHRVFHLLYQFCVVELSAVYFDILKDRLYTWPKRSIGRRAAQTVLYEILESLVLLLAPILSFTAEEAYQAMSGDKAESVFLNQMPRPSAGLRDEDLEMEFEQLFRVRALVMRRLEIDRQAKNIGSSLEAKVLMAIEDERTRSLVDKYLENLPAFFIVSGIDLVEKEKLSAGSLYDNDIKLGVDIKRAEGSKCRRCWIYSTEVGENDTYPDLCTKCVNALEER